MKYANIKELKVSLICLGTVPFGKEISEKKSFELLDTFISLGGNFIDTANIYSDWLPGEKGASEKTIGKWLKKTGIRKKLIIGTKGGHPKLSNMSVSRIDEKNLRNDLNESLERLMIDYIDIYWLHRDDNTKPVSEIVEIMNEFIKEGKIKYTGCSNWKIERIKQANKYAEQKKLSGFIANQPWWSLAVLNFDNVQDKTLVYLDREGIKYHKENQLPCVPYSSQANGFFSKEYGRQIQNPKRPSSESVIKFYYNEKNFDTLEKVKKIAEKHKVTPNQVALACLLNQGFPVFPIIGPKNLEQLKDSCLAVDINLEKEDILSPW